MNESISCIISSKRLTFLSLLYFINVRLCISPDAENVLQHNNGLIVLTFNPLFSFKYTIFLNQPDL